MKFTFVTVSGKRPAWLADVTEDYKTKLSYWLKTEFVVLAPSQMSRDGRDKKKAAESKSILDFLKDDDFLIACDENGKVMTTPVFAQRLEVILGGGKKRVVIAVGGAYGLDEATRKRADLLLSLSPFVTSHHMALAFISEQVYRAMTILKNVQYHNE